MILVEEVRQEIISTFKAAQDTAYPSMLVNYPNYLVVDLEHQEEPFVTVGLDLVETPVAALGEREILVKGTLILYYYYREGTGVSSAFTYTDFINAELGMKLVNAIQYHAVKSNTFQAYPGWGGRMTVLSFDVVSSVSC